MNRSLMNVIMGGMGTKSQGKGKAKAIEGTATEATAQQVPKALANFLASNQSHFCCLSGTTIMREHFLSTQ